jgi:hypothetical protein
MNRRVCLAVVSLAILLDATPALAAGSYAGPRGGHSLSVWGVFDAGGPGGVGLGMRLTLPLVPEGVLRHPTIKDEFVLELGADFVHYGAQLGFYPYYIDYTWNGVLPVVGAAWNVWFTPRFAIYPKLDLGYWIGWWGGWNTYYGATYGYIRPSYGGFFIQGALGFIYRLDPVALRAELGTGLLRLGVAFQF